MRRMVGEGQEIFRVVVERYHVERNPAWKPGSSLPLLTLLDSTHLQHFGPYNSLGTAKGVLTRETRDAYEGLRHGVAGGWIEKAEISWTKVDL